MPGLPEWIEAQQADGRTVETLRTYGEGSGHEMALAASTGPDDSELACLVRGDTVLTVPIFEHDGKLHTLVSEQYRVGSSGELVEFPAVMAEKGKTALQVAQQALLQKTTLDPDWIRDVQVFDIGDQNFNSPGGSTEQTQIALAKVRLPMGTDIEALHDQVAGLGILNDDIRTEVREFNSELLQTLGSLPSKLAFQLAEVELQKDQERDLHIIPVRSEYQSMSLVVPGGCPNKCEFCVSDMHRKNLKAVFKDEVKRREVERAYRERMEWVRDKDVDTIVLTGDGEPLSNKLFLEFFNQINQSLPSPFKKIEIQSSGVGLTDEKLALLKRIGVKTFALSISSLDSDENTAINRTPEKVKIDVQDTIDRLKEAGINVRLCVNLNDSCHKFFDEGVDAFMKRIKGMGVDQLTFRRLYTSGDNTPQDQWIENHLFDEDLMEQINRYIQQYGRPVCRLPFGAIVYSVQGRISTIVDDDCMNSKGLQDTQKFTILHKDGKLYSLWDDLGSLIF